MSACWFKYVWFDILRFDLYFRYRKAGYPITICFHVWPTLPAICVTISRCSTCAAQPPARKPTCLFQNKPISNPPLIQPVPYSVQQVLTLQTYLLCGLVVLLMRHYAKNCYIFLKKKCFRLPSNFAGAKFRKLSDIIYKYKRYISTDYGTNEPRWK